MDTEMKNGSEQPKDRLSLERLSLPDLKALRDRKEAERANLNGEMAGLSNEWDKVGGVGALDLIPLLQEWVSARRSEERAMFGAQFGGFGRPGGGILAGGALRAKFDEVVNAPLLMKDGERTKGLQFPFFAAFGDDVVRIWSDWAREKFGNYSSADFIRKRAEIDAALDGLRARMGAVEAEIRQINDYIKSVLQ